MTRETLEVRSYKREPGWTLFGNQSYSSFCAVTFVDFLAYDFINMFLQFLALDHLGKILLWWHTLDEDGLCGGEGYDWEHHTESRGSSAAIILRLCSQMSVSLSDSPSEVSWGTWLSVSSQGTFLLWSYLILVFLVSCVMNRDLQNINFWPKTTLLTPFWSVRVNKWWRSFSRIVPKGYKFWAAGVKHGGADVIMRKDPRRSGHLLLCWQSSECCRDFREN